MKLQGLVRTGLSMTSNIMILNHVRICKANASKQIIYIYYLQL